MASITLYQYETCPFCARVRAKLEEKGIEYEKVNVERDPNDPTRKEVIEKSGCETVPVIHFAEQDLWMGESGDIVAYIEENF